MIQRIGFGDFPRFHMPRKKRVEFAMFDSVTVSEIPPDAPAVAGYVNGHWPTFPTLRKSHPHAKRLSIAVTADADADCLDVEKGDAVPAQAPGWVKRQRRRHPIRYRVKPPVVYCSLSVVPGLLQTLAASGVRRKQIRLWTAHYTGRPHRCGPACAAAMPTVADATQWTDASSGRNLDESLCAPNFL